MSEYTLHSNMCVCCVMRISRYHHDYFYKNRKCYSNLAYTDVTFSRKYFKIPTLDMCIM